MSDRELVTIDPQQLTALEMLLGNIASTLSDKLGHVERTLHGGLEAIAQSGGTASNSEVLTAINNLDRKVDKFMATQEERLQGISTKIDEVLSDLAALRANNPQIEDEISAIEAKLSIAQPTTDTTGVITGDEG